MVKCDDELPDKFSHAGDSGLRVAQNNESVKVPWRIENSLCEVEVRGDTTKLFSLADCSQNTALGAVQVFLGDSGYLMTVLFQ